MSGEHVLVVEDELKISQLLRDYLERDGYHVTVQHSGEDTVETVRALAPALVLLDLMLPGKDGLTICREVRQFSEIPIIMVTARVDEIDRLLGLELGADDYVCKPFSPREVVARVRTVLRRAAHAPPTRSEDAVSYRGVTLDLDRYRCEVEGTEVEMTPVEFRLLHGLIAHQGRVFSRNQLMDLCYVDERVVSDRTIDTHIKNIRRKLSAVLGEDDLIHSIYGVGYKID